MLPGSLWRLIAAILLGLSLAPRAAVRGDQSSPLTPGAPSQVRAAASPSGLILGQVIDATTNKPIGRAIVTLTGAATIPVIAGGQGPQRVLTDAEGHFLFRNLSKGTYAFSATAPGYLYGEYGQRRPAGSAQPFILEDGQRVGDVVVRLWRESVIGGVVTDETGAPVSGVTVMINRRITVNGRTELRAQGYGKRTDDRGAYSQGSIPPGEYVVTVPTGMTVVRIGQMASDAASLRVSGADALAAGAAARSAGVRTGDVVVLSGGINTLAGQLPLTTRPDGRVVTYTTTFHPSNGTLTEAGVIKLGVGEERTDIDVHLRPVATAPVSGTLVSPEGPAVNSAVHLIPAYAAHSPLERTFEAAVTMTDQAGHFVFPAVATGSYVLEAWRMPSRNVSLIDQLTTEPSLWAEAPISVDTAPVTVTLPLRRGSALRGRIVLEGNSPPPRPQQFQSVLGRWFEPPWPLAVAGGPLGQTRVTATWDFMREGVPPGTYAPNVVSNFGPPAGWYFKSATFEGRDLLTSPLVLDGQDVAGIVITFTDRPTTMSGLVTDSTGRPDPTAAVLVFPADYQAWVKTGLAAGAARTVATTQTGAYAIPHLPPGDYLIVAADIDAIDDWQQPSVVQSLAAQATRVTLANGAATRVDLRRR